MPGVPTAFKRRQRDTDFGRPELSAWSIRRYTALPSSLYGYASRVMDRRHAAPYGPTPRTGTPAEMLAGLRPAFAEPPEPGLDQLVEEAFSEASTWTQHTSLDTFAAEDSVRPGVGWP